MQIDNRIINTNEIGDRIITWVRYQQRMEDTKCAEKEQGGKPVRREG